METKEDWIEAMRAMPDDVVLMCAFSDWLEEHDDPMWEGMSLLAEYGIVGRETGYWDHSLSYPAISGIGDTWWFLDWDTGNRVDERINLCNAFYICDDEKKARIRQELAELYPNSDAMRAAVDMSTPA